MGEGTGFAVALLVLNIILLITLIGFGQRLLTKLEATRQGLFYVLKAALPFADQDELNFAISSPDIQAVENVVQAYEKELGMKKPVGFNHSDGKMYRFMVPPTHALLTRLGDAVVYEGEENAV